MQRTIARYNSVPSLKFRFGAVEVMLMVFNREYMTDQSRIYYKLAFSDIKFPLHAELNNSEL
jgi:hypothetical protein